jgi:hypothetical protein
MVMRFYQKIAILIVQFADKYTLFEDIIVVNRNNILIL